MIEDIVSIRLPVEETFRIRKNVIRRGEGKRVCVVTGIHGALQAIGYAMLVLFFVIGMVKTCGSFADMGCATSWI